MLDAALAREMRTRERGSFRKFMQSKYWCFTLNNYTEDELVQLRVFGGTLGGSGPTYLLYGREVGESGTPHLQGYVEYSTRQRMAQVKRDLGSRVHLEKRRGRADQAAEYCKKDGDFEEFGKLSGNFQGRRTDLDAFKEAVEGGADFREATDQCFTVAIKYRRGLREWYQDRQPREIAEKEVICFWGETGTGKSHTVWTTEAINDIWKMPHSNGMWFDGYDGQPVALFDEFSGSRMSVGQFLEITDKYPQDVPVKGSFVRWRPKKVYFCSNIDPREWWPSITDPVRAAVMRRFTRIMHFSQPFRRGD